MPAALAFRHMTHDMDVVTVYLYNTVFLCSVDLIVVNRWWLVIEPILVLNLVRAQSSRLGSVPNRLQIGRRIAAALYECAAAHMAH